MRDFLFQLDLSLQLLAAPVAERDPSSSVLRPVPAVAPPSSRARRSPYRRPALVIGFAGLATAIATTILLSGSAAAVLPILETETSDASIAAGASALNGTDLRHGHAFDTPSGPGYVVTTPNRDRLCITAPDSGTPGSYGGACTPLVKAKREGLALEVVGDLMLDPNAVNFLAFVLPTGATGARVDTGRDARPAIVQHGVLTASLARRGIVRFTLRGSTVTVPFEGPFRTVGAACGDRIVPMPTARTDASGRTILPKAPVCE